MLEESYSRDKRRKRRFRRKKRRRAERDFQPMRAGIVIFVMFVLLIGVVGVCLWAVIPGILRYLRLTLGWGGMASKGAPQKTARRLVAFRR